MKYTNKSWSKYHRKITIDSLESHSHNKIKEFSIFTSHGLTRSFSDERNAPDDQKGF